jgi:hypothetical protein
MGSEDWFSFDWSANEPCTHLTITFTTTDSLHYEVWNNFVAPLSSGTASQTLTTPGTYVIRVLGNPASSGSYTGRWSFTLTVAE